MRPIYHPHGHVFDILISVKSNDIINIFVKSIFVPKIAFYSIYDTIVSKELRPLKWLKQTAINCAFKFRL